MKRVDRTSPHIWVAEVCYLNVGWYTPWTTCRLTRAECRMALEEHPTRPRHTDSRIIKFIRKAEAKTEGGGPQVTNWQEKERLAQLRLRWKRAIALKFPKYLIAKARADWVKAKAEAKK